MDRGFSNTKYNMDRAALPRTYLGYKYKFDKVRNGITYMECGQSEFVCNGRINIQNGNITITMKHTHQPDPLLAQKEEFKEALKHDVQFTDIYVPPKQIYDKLREIYPTAGRAVPWTSVSTSMWKYRQQVLPPTPVSLTDMQNILRDEKWLPLLQYNRGKIVTRLVVAADNSVSLLMLNPLFAAKFIHANELYVDATFQVTPKIKKVSQLFVIMADKFDHIFPIAWALMERKTTASYIAVLREFSNAVPEIQPAVINADFEEAIRNAALTIFPNSSFQGCNTHFVRAIHRKFEDKTVVNQRLYKNSVEMKKIRDKLTSLSYLPPDDINAGFARIKRDASLEATAALAGIFDYFESQWIIRTTPAHFSVHGALRRSTNYVESHNSLLFYKMKSHPSVWQFVGKIMFITKRIRHVSECYNFVHYKLFSDRLKNVLSSTHADLDSVRNGVSVFRAPRRKTLIRGELLQELWDNYARGLPIEQFLEDASILNKRVSQQLYNDNDD